MLPPFKQVDLLHNSSDGHSESMAIHQFFAHCDLDTHTNPAQRMQAAGYSSSSWAENIAAGYGTPSAVIAGWMSSSGHRANILNASRREFGVGYEYSNDSSVDRMDTNSNCAQDKLAGPYYNYWTQNFGSRSGVYPVVIERELAETSNQSVDLYTYGVGVATSMRFSNDGTNWSSWVTYNPDHSWTLSPGGGSKTVYSQISTGANGGGTIYNASDQILYISDCDPMVFSNMTLSGEQTFTACEIIADPNVMISGQIIFEAGTVTLGENVEIPMSATLEVHIE
ncbi:MAG: CAP domain-containing protein [Saprospiraceae bacterium]|nr:CAP domain-containing protein [Saprospiraceae bacterium]